MFPRLHFVIANGESRSFDDSLATRLISEDERVKNAAALVTEDGWKGSASVDEICRPQGGEGKILVPN